MLEAQHFGRHRFPEGQYRRRLIITQPGLLPFSAVDQSPLRIEA
jgi:hypothetical protein